MNLVKYQQVTNEPTTQRRYRKKSGVVEMKLKQKNS
jgi:hypothetical protein